MKLTRKANKARFRVVPKELRTSFDGKVFASKNEMQRYLTLAFLERAGEIRDLELQPKFPVAFNGQKLCTYTADFRYFDVRRGKTIIEDAKTDGTRIDPYYRLRKRAAEIAYGIEIDEVVS